MSITPNCNSDASTPCTMSTRSWAERDSTGEETTAGALADALSLGAVGSEYIANLLESGARQPAEPGPLHLTRPSDALELDLPDPDLADYDRHLDPETTT